MTHSQAAAAAPRRQVRRFDVFAEYNRQKNLRKGMPDTYAKGEALWVAKVVASRGGGIRSRLHRGDAAHGHDAQTGERDAPAAHTWEFKSLDGEAQTDQLFENEVVKRMGREFYDEVFAPAIARAVAEGSRYEDSATWCGRPGTPPCAPGAQRRPDRRLVPSYPADPTPFLRRGYAYGSSGQAARRTVAGRCEELRGADCLFAGPAVELALRRVGRQVRACLEPQVAPDTPVVHLA